MLYKYLKFLCRINNLNGKTKNEMIKALETQFDNIDQYYNNCHYNTTLYLRHRYRFLFILASSFGWDFLRYGRFKIYAELIKRKNVGVDKKVVEDFMKNLSSDQCKYLNKIYHAETVQDIIEASFDYSIVFEDIKKKIHIF